MIDEEFVKRNNLRRINDKNCGACCWFYYSDTCAVCDLEGGPIWDKIDREEYNYICDEFELRK